MKDNYDHEGNLGIEAEKAGYSVRVWLSLHCWFGGRVRHEPWLEEGGKASVWSYQCCCMLGLGRWGDGEGTAWEGMGDTTSIARSFLVSHRLVYYMLCMLSLG